MRGLTRILAYSAMSVFPLLGIIGVGQYFGQDTEPEPFTFLQTSLLGAGILLALLLSGYSLWQVFRVLRENSEETTGIKILYSSIATFIPLPSLVLLMMILTDIFGTYAQPFTIDIADADNAGVILFWIDQLLRGAVFDLFDVTGWSVSPLDLNMTNWPFVALVILFRLVVAGAIVRLLLGFMGLKFIRKTED